jgi:NADH dehydrogenase
MSKVIIIGGGFGGISALKRLSWYRVGAEVTLIEKKETSDFLPALPDVIGRGVKPDRIAVRIKSFVSGSRARFIQTEVSAIDIPNQEVHCAGERLPYDYLIIATGSETNFYGQADIKKYGYKLDDAEDALLIRKTIEKGSFDNIIVAGGGYTGLEAATNIKLYCNKNKLATKVSIVEKTKSILGSLPQEIKEYAALNLVNMGVKTYFDATVSAMDHDNVELSNGDVFKNAMLIWTPGVKTGALVDMLKLQKGAAGRIKVDEYLRAIYEPRVFVAGDSAEFIQEGKPLRMSVQFAVSQGAIAGENVACSIRNKPLKKFKPVDSGYIVPMANNLSCGIVFTNCVKGRLATFLHYAICICKLPGFNNKLGLLKDILF